MVEREFQNAEGAEAVRSSHGYFGFVVETFDHAAGKLFSGFEVVQQKGAVSSQRAAIFFMGSMRLRMVWRHQKSRNRPAQVGEL